ncbi:MAG: LemA domain protein [Bacillaceae bacterium]
MENDKELLRIRVLGDEILKDLLKEAYFDHEPKLRDSVENLARTVVALTDIALEKDNNPESTLRYVVSKMRQASNAIKEQA